jgi:BMFP domain-containing protein YqiC
MSYFLDPNDPGSLPKYAADYGPTLLNQIQGLAGYYEEMMDEDESELRQLKARVAALEEVERKAIEQSEYIQSHGLTEFEMDRLRARVAELEARIRDLQVIHNDAYERSRPTELEELRAERDGLKARVAELESHIAATDPWKGEG